MIVRLNRVMRTASARSAERDEELRQQRHRVSFGVRLGAKHELARGSVERGLGWRGQPAGHSNSPFRMPCHQRRAEPVDRLLTLKQLIFEFDDATLKLGDPLAVRLGRERGGDDRR